MDSGLVMYPAGHARNTTADVADILIHKWNMLGEIALPDGGDAGALVARIESITDLGARGLNSFYDFNIADRAGYEE